MLALRHDLIRAGPHIASSGRCIKLEVELDVPGAVTQPERVVAYRTDFRQACLHMLADAVRTADGMPAYEIAPRRQANTLSLNPCLPKVIRIVPISHPSG